MLETVTITIPGDGQHSSAVPQAIWAIRARLLWRHRRVLARVTTIALILALVIAFLIPKRYKSMASIMPPDQQNSGALMLAALTAHGEGLGSLGALASGLLGGHTTTALFIDLLRSGTVSENLINRFDLQRVYHKRYRIDTARHLAHLTTITEDKKSGVITIQVEDTSRVRARDLAQGYIDELNKLVMQTNTSAAHQERIFIERRLQSVSSDLERAQIDLSEFSSRNSTIDIKEQTRAMVDAGARVQGELLVEQSGLQSLRQIYGDQNVRVRESEARIATLQRELEKLAGSYSPVADADAEIDSSAGNDKGELYPPLRELPRLAVSYTDLYRSVRVQESVFELLTQQYEMARIQEAKDIPVISVIDPPGIPEKKSFPPRLLIALCLTAISFITAATLILIRDHWSKIDAGDPRRELASEVVPVLRGRFHALFGRARGAA